MFTESADARAARPCLVRTAAAGKVYSGASRSSPIVPLLLIFAFSCSGADGGHRSPRAPQDATNCGRTRGDRTGKIGRPADRPVVARPPAQPGQPTGTTARRPTATTPAEATTGRRRRPFAARHPNTRGLRFRTPTAIGTLPKCFPFTFFCLLFLYTANGRQTVHLVAVRRPLGFPLLWLALRWRERPQPLLARPCLGLDLQHGHSLVQPCP